jgi:tetratricopeptide (TPR) repeat protein
MSKRRTWIDYAIWAVAALTIGLFAYLGYAYWQQQVYQRQTSPAARAVANLEGIVKKMPADPGARVRLAQAYLAADRVDDAVQQYQDALKLQKDYPDALMGLGLIAMDQKDWRTAEGYWKRIIDKLENGEYSAKDDRLEAGYYYMGTVFIEEHNYDDAISYLKQALRIRPDASDTHYTLSVAYKNAGSPKKQLEELKIALMFDSKMPEANYDMGQLLLKQGDVASAAEHFRASADKAPKNIDKPQKALDALGEPADHVKKAESLARTNVASATAEARIAVALDPEDPSSLRILAQLYEKQQRKQQALDHYTKLSATPTGRPRAFWPVPAIEYRYWGGGMMSPAARSADGIGSDLFSVK